MELAVICLFCILLLLCVALGYPVVLAMGSGLLLFLFFGKWKGISWQELFASALEGVKTVKTILVIFLLIGILTAIWRMSGTIPYLVCRSAVVLHPSVFLLMTFLLNCGLSFLTGTSFGTAATIGTICAAMGGAMEVSPILTGGAMLSGIYFGDRCSPVSTSALLISEITDTEIYGNVRNMMRSGLWPFVISCMLYGLIGFMTEGEQAQIELTSLFAEAFDLHWVCVLPAVLILLLALFHADVRITMGLSILSALPICLYVQHVPLSEILRAICCGFVPDNPELAAMISGGGIVSMLQVAGVVLLSSTYAGLFRRTGLVDGVRGVVAKMKERTGTYPTMLLTSLVTACISCSQTLSILLTKELCGKIQKDRRLLALDLEDSAAVLAALVPWSIACSVPLAATGSPIGSIGCAFFLILLPLWRMVRQSSERETRGKSKGF